MEHIRKHVINWSAWFLTMPGIYQVSGNVVYKVSTYRFDLVKHLINVRRIKRKYLL